MSLALYRKYRPALFEDVLGQELIVRILKESAKSNKLAHAYLFSGPRGTGKTTTARLIAKIANCEKRQTQKSFAAEGEPCNACPTCTQIDQGRSLDVVEIDAASNRGIDEIRNLKESIRLAPASSLNKIFIIDEAHQLTKEAFNALLKTLEEPPTHVIFVLATTELDKIPATILSRTQQFHFKYVPLETIVEKLSHIAHEEKMNIHHETLELIAQSGGGSFRDAESLLGQLVATGKKEITTHDVETLIGNVGFETVARFCELVLTRNRPDMVKLLSDIEQGGFNLVQFTKDLIEHIRRVAVLRHSPAMKDVLKRELTGRHLDVLITHTQIFKDSDLGLLKRLISAYSQMRYSQFPVIPLEIALLESDEKN